VTIGGVTFEAYDDTLKWVTTHFHKDDWNFPPIISSGMSEKEQ
jgi:hypothetical protein